MSSKPGWILVRVIAAPISRVIERGSPLAVSIGTLLGASIGAAMCYWQQINMIVGVLSGTIIGAIGGALCAKRRLGERAKPGTGSLQDDGIGEKRYAYVRRDEEAEVAYACVVCDHALVSLRFLAGHFSPGAEFDRFLHQLDRPAEIDLNDGEIVPLAAIESFDLVEPHAILIQWDSRGERKSTLLMFEDVNHRNELLMLLSRRHGTAFGEDRRPLPMFESVLVPGIATALLLIPAALAIWFAERWRQHPPAPPAGKDVDPLVAFLTRLGPRGVFPWACLVIGIPALWFAWRIFKPLECDVLLVGPVNKRWTGNFADPTQAERTLA